MKIELSTLTTLRLAVLAHLPAFFLFGYICSRIAQKLSGLEMFLAVGLMVIVFAVICTISIMRCLWRIAPL